MKIAKEFRWEMGHRLPEHFGNCKNIHGHSYKMIVEIEGEVNSSGMVMDYYDLKKAVNPLIEKLDHAFMVNEDDKAIIDFLEQVSSKKVVVGFQSTVENICSYIISQIKDSFPSNVSTLRVRIYETYDDYAELSVSLSDG
jgi:6-pyruvoyltetrahydropterin/6-carboxytetrahydropterin synthase